MSLLSIKKVLRNPQNIIGQYLCCLSLEMFWSVACTTDYMITLSTLSPQTAQYLYLSQQGFLRRRSCDTQLLSVLHIIGQSFDENIQTDVIYLDFTKAFDSVAHKILLHKIASYGVTDLFYDWFVGYLTGRRQRLVVNGATSR